MSAVVFHPESREGMNAQALFYEARGAGLGQRFLAEIEIAVERANAMPNIGSPYLHRTRRVFPKSFPHSIIYRVMGGSLVIMAIAPFRRRPGYWRERT